MPRGREKTKSSYKASTYQTNGLDWWRRGRCLPAHCLRGHCLWSWPGRPPERLNWNEENIKIKKDDLALFFLIHVSITVMGDISKWARSRPAGRRAGRRAFSIFTCWHVAACRPSSWVQLAGVWSEREGAAFSASPYVERTKQQKNKRTLHPSSQRRHHPHSFELT